MKCAEFIEAIQPEVLKTVQKNQVKVMDLGCGTGLVGQYLYEKGYTNVDGIDASQGMLNESK